MNYAGRRAAAICDVQDFSAAAVFDCSSLLKTLVHHFPVRSPHHTTLSPLPTPPLLMPLKLPLHPIRWKQTHTYSITHTISTAIVTVSACNHIHQHHHHHHSIYCHHQHTQSLAQENTALQRPSFSTVGVFIHVTHRGTVHNLGM